MGTLNIPVRYWAMHSGSPEENLESNPSRSMRSEICQC